MVRSAVTGPRRAGGRAPPVATPTPLLVAVAVSPSCTRPAWPPWHHQRGRFGAGEGRAVERGHDVRTEDTPNGADVADVRRYGKNRGFCCISRYVDHDIGLPHSKAFLPSAPTLPPMERCWVSSSTFTRSSSTGTGSGCVVGSASCARRCFVSSSRLRARSCHIAADYRNHASFPSHRG